LFRNFGSGHWAIPPHTPSITTRKCQDFALAHWMPRFLWLQRWPRCSSVCPSAREPRLANVFRVRERSMTSKRSIDIDASGTRYHPQIPVRSRALENSANPTWRYPTRTLLGGACSQVSGKKRRIWVNSARRAHAMRRTTTTTFDLTTYNSPLRSQTSLVKIWRSHDGLSV